MKSLAFSATLLLFVAGTVNAEKATSPPNILFIFADDQCFETIASLGNDEIQTPSLDRIASRATTFTHAYNMGSWSGAVCVASRTMLNSGRMVWNANGIYNRSEEERKAGRWWSEIMKTAGYKTYFTGKWHCKANPNHAFDVARNVRGGMPNQTEAGYHRPPAHGNDPWTPWDPKFEGFWKGGKHWSEVVGDDAIDFIGEAESHNEPFFMYIAFNAPHDPRQSPKEYVDRYPRSKIEIPKNFLPEYPHKDLIGCGAGLRDEKLGTFPRTEQCVRLHRQEYYAIITHMDAQIGRILDRIQSSNKADNTWIIFTADHGLACGQHGLLGKQNLYDHSVRVPFMVVAPDARQSRKINAPIYLQDAMPTTLELAGIEIPEHVDFQSLLPVLDGQPSTHDAIYGAYLQLQRSVRTDRHKLIVYPKANVVKLFDMVADPYEMNDLAAKTGSAELKKQLFGKLLDLQSQLGDKLDLRKTFPELL